ncbi:hypothetical protein [Krasilnikovia sp. MM14-A1259]|uniref:hypothetical protein n=1 Tax=Krasilnikovia sp. MM14-A1259 TaxID=3373539 RepID=UPI00382639F5
MNETTEHDGYEPDVDIAQAVLDGERLTAALRALGPIEPRLAEVLTSLHLRIYPGYSGASDRSTYVVLDVHGVSIGVQRRAHDLYLHADTTDTDDALISSRSTAAAKSTTPSDDPARTENNMNIGDTAR